MSGLQWLTQRAIDTSIAHTALGGAALPDAPGTPAWPEQRLRMVVESGTDATWREAWCSDGPLQQEQVAGLQWRCGHDLLYGLIELDEPAPHAPERGKHLRERTREAYLRLFALLSEREMPHLWRVWNFMADINRDEDGLERYRWFNLGRHDACSAVGAASAAQMPAASALGWAQGPLSIAFLAGRKPPRPIENPRQMSAFHYPGDYGPRPPLFARAALAESGRHEWLWVSGTASIVGHQTVHTGDVVAQCEETARNVLTVLDQANQVTRTAGHRAEALSHRVYVRHTADFPVVRRALERCLGGAGLTLMQADICRHDLLVEVESVAHGLLLA